MNSYIKLFKSKWVLLALAALVILTGLVVSNRAATARPQEDVTIILPGARFVGWVEVSGTVQASRVSQLINDPQVFLVDVMELFLESKLTDEALAAARYDKRARQEMINTGYANLAHWTVTWGAYHLGLMKLDTQE